MQTFLPYESFHQSLTVLDKKRLGKQRVEAYQILRAIHDSSYGWQSHPAVRMWRNYPSALIEYYNASLDVFEAHGGHNIKLSPMDVNKSAIIYPPWLGNAQFHASHRSNLLRKDYNHYSKYGWTEALDLPYVWPL